MQHIQQDLADSLARFSMHDSELGEQMLSEQVCDHCCFSICRGVGI
jgi:hypothetical protein